MATSSKRRKVVKDEENQDQAYVHGSIVRIKLTDFLTYDSVEFRPGPQLNVIIGPNGTGKSTIVCAICLGLGGKTSILGRAQQPSDYVKYGKAEAHIEIELKRDDEENLVITRKIPKKGTNSWSINGRSATMKLVEETVAKLTIQVGNLCQFLPQDKVADFAKMSQQELLESTEKAVGPINMYENHQKLKTARQTGRELELAFKERKKTLEKEQEKNARLEQDVKNFEERKKFEDRIKLLKMKKPWLEYEDKRKKFIEEKNEKDRIAKEYEEASKKFEPMKKKSDAVQRKLEGLERSFKQKTAEVKKNAELAKKISDSIDNQDTRTNEIQVELQAKKTDENRRQKKLADVMKQLDAYKNDLNNLVEEDVAPKIKEVSEGMSEVNMQLRQTENQKQNNISSKHQLGGDIRALQNQLKQIQDVGNQRLEILRKAHMHTYNAVLWLRANQAKFRGAIHEPLILTMNVKDKRNAKYLENHISFNDMRAFVCEYQEDMKTFVREVRDTQKLKINAAMAPTETNFKPRVPIEKYSKFGFHSYLWDLFECPDPVKRYLCSLYRIHNIPVGNEQTKANVANVIKTCPQLATFYTANHQYNVKKSKYNQAHVSTRSTELRKPRFLTLQVDTDQEKQLKDNLRYQQSKLEEIDVEQTQLAKMVKDLNAKMDHLRNEKKNLMAQRDMRKQLQQKIKTKEDSVKNLEEEAVDLEKETEKAKKEVLGVIKKKMELIDDLQDKVQRCTVSSVEKSQLSVQHAEASYEKAKVDEQRREEDNRISALKAQFERIKDQLKITKDSAKRLLVAAKRATNTPQDEEISEQMRNDFARCPITVEEIDGEINETQARADCIFQTDAGVIEEFNKRKKEIIRLSNECSSKEDSLEKHQQEIEEIKANWFEPLQELIGRINKNFSFFFKSMKCAGEVDLNVPENPEDYEKYGVRIKVKYRDTEQLRELTPHHQSGGERSVATILYMMALQEMTKCPFRCVDEINQGMDPYNERKVFDLLVRTVCKRNSSQYFLLTPKLLPDLEFGDDMTVLCVYNGPTMLNHTEWNLKKFLRRRKHLED